MTYNRLWVPSLLLYKTFPVWAWPVSLTCIPPLGLIFRPSGEDDEYLVGPNTSLMGLDRYTRNICVRGTYTQRAGVIRYAGRLTRRYCICYAGRLRYCLRYAGRLRKNAFIRSLFISISQMDIYWTIGHAICKNLNGQFLLFLSPSLMYKKYHWKEAFKNVEHWLSLSKRKCVHFTQSDASFRIFICHCALYRMNTTYTVFIHCTYTIQYTVAKFKPIHLHRLLQPLAEFYDTLDKYMHVGYVLAIGKEHKLSD